MFLIPLLIVGLSAACFVAATEMLIRSRVIPVDAFTWHLHRFLSGNNENVVFGDSHTSNGVHGLSDFLNLSYSRDFVPTIEVKIRAYFADKHPGKIILQADAHMFAPERQTDPPDSVSLFSTKTSTVRLWMFSDLHINNVGKYWKIFFSPSGFENTYTFHQDGSFTNKGKGWMDLSAESRLAQVKKRVLSTVYRPEEAPEATRSARSYQRILENLTSRGAEVCMVGMPLTKLHRSSMKDMPEFERARLLLQSLADKYGVRYVEMSAAITNEALFDDSEHLNEAGALEFAPLLETACFGSSRTN